MEDFIAILSTPLTAGAIAGAFTVFVLLGKLIPSRTFKEVQALWEKVIEREQEVNNSLLESVKKLTAQGEITIAILESLPKESKNTHLTAEQPQNCGCSGGIVSARSQNVEEE